MLSAGVLIAGKYRVSKKLGEGAMGSVWLAKNELTDREFAIKVLLPQAAASATGLARFLREAKVCGALRHPSILEIYDAGEAPELGGAPYLVMERLEGAPLDVVIRESGAMAPRLAIDILVQISRGLQLAHAKGIVHRDLKPANVFLHNPGTGAIEPKVLDFGISKVLDQGSPEVALTHTSAILGSPMYMSPEQMGVGTVFDARSDVHALGILLWECLTARAPFVSTSYNLLVVEIIQGPRPKLRDAMPSASKELARIVEKAFAIDKTHRFASAADFADALETELARVGGGVLSSRTAVRDVLGTLDLESKPAPRIHATTTEPLSIDPAVVSPTARSVGGTLLSRGSIPGSGKGPGNVAAISGGAVYSSSGSASRRSSPDSFAETELAAGGDVAVRVPLAAAASGAQDKPKGQRSILVWAMAAGGLVVALLAVGAIMLGLRQGTAPDTRVSSDPAAGTGTSLAAAPPTSAAATAAPVVPSASVAVPTALVAGAVPSATPVTSAATATARPPVAVDPPKRTHTHSAPTAAPAPRPRIDQSGL